MIRVRSAFGAAALVAALAACSSGSPGSGSGRAQPTSSARTPAPTERPQPAPVEESHFARAPMDAATKAKEALAKFVDASATDMQAYHRFRRLVSLGEPFFRDRLAEAAALFGEDSDRSGGPLGRLDAAVANGDRQAIDVEAPKVKQALSALQGFFAKNPIGLRRVVVLLPLAAYELGAILAGSRPGVASTPKGRIADAQGRLDAIEQMIAFNNQYVSPSLDYAPAYDKVGARMTTLRKALAAAEATGELSDIASLVVQTGHLSAELRALIGASSDLWLPPKPAVSALDKPSPMGMGEPTSVLTLPRSRQDTWSGAAPIDRFARGDEKALSPDERRGFDVAAGKARCFRCHAPPLFGLTFPPTFRTSIAAITGVTKGPTSKDLDPSPAVATDVPSLRNIDKTAPYFHNSAFPTLESVVDFYDRGGGRGLGADVPDQHPDVRKLDLTPDEKKALLRFLRVSLSDPKSAPR